ncbi:hypothetical protein ACTWQL_14945 [Pseudalkalibacillus sp. R45]|uniref:hypothetical protein n=1 Tax=Pseudalkalibacillus sp. R45 TaxID=3457433 RepID=UPI003FCEB541
MEFLVHQMRDYSYAQYPIYQNKECIGLLSASALVNWMADHVVNSIVDLSNYQIKDILEYEKDHPVAFARKSINIFEIEDLYESYHQNGDDLEAVIITEKGEKDETPLGVVTAWDLIEIDYKAE